MKMDKLDGTGLGVAVLSCDRAVGSG